MDAEYKDMNESAPIPSLTLEPELENTPKLVVAEETKLQQTKVAEPVLTPQEQQMVDDFAQKIDVENTAQILQYGAGTQKKMADFSDAALANVRTQDLGEVGDLIVNVVGELKGFDAEEEKGFLGFFLHLGSLNDGLNLRLGLLATALGLGLFLSLGRFLRRFHRAADHGFRLV